MTTSDHFQSLIDREWSNRIIIGQDIHTGHRLLKNGGHGFGHLLRIVQHQEFGQSGQFWPRQHLDHEQAPVAGITDVDWSKLSHQNAARLFSIEVA